jgi:hypothetical protein
VFFTTFLQIGHRSLTVRVLGMAGIIVRRRAQAQRDYLSNRLSELLQRAAAPALNDLRH